MMATMTVPTPADAFPPGIPADSPPAESREQLYAQIRGSSVILPDFEQMMHHYPFKLHPDVRKLDEDVHHSLAQ